MANLKSLVKDTAIYGMSSIVGRFLNYLLVPLYTNVFPAENGGYGVITNIYSYTALILPLLTFGMETTFFRYANDDKEKPDTVFSTTLAMVSTLSILFLALVFIFIDPIGFYTNYPNHHEYLLIMGTCVAIDSIQAIPFCYLRFRKRPIKFALIKLLFIAMNVSLNVIYYIVLKKTEVYYVFAINLACTSLLTFFFIPELFSIKWKVDLRLLFRMFSYSWPIFILSVTAVLNQALDKIIFPWAYTLNGENDIESANSQLGIYGACVKIAMIMAMITQAFRFAYEPIVFAKSRDADSKEYYGVAMKYFIIFTLFAFLCVIGYLDILKFVIGEDYHEGLKVVPIVMAAEIMMGIYFNLSFWYKLIDKTYWGTIFSLMGCLVLAAVNIIFIPKYGYMACAWGGFSAYATAMTLCYIVGRFKNPIEYDLKSIGTYVLITALFFVAMQLSAYYVVSVPLRLVINTVLILLFVAHVIYHDLPLASLPVIGKYFRKK